MLERERKFKVDTHKLNRDQFDTIDVIEQGYLMLGDGKQLRVRLVNYKRAYLTYKSDINDTDRSEFEYEIPFTDGTALFNSCEYLTVYKVRMSMVYKGNPVCVDVYHDAVVCEIEYTTYTLESEFIPDFCTDDITADKWYSNINFAIRKRDGIVTDNPYSRELKLKTLERLKQ